MSIQQPSRPSVAVPRLNGSALKRKYDFRPDVLDVIISGRSAIDASEGFELQDLDEVNRFVSGYGYDLDNPIERAEVHGNFHEALNFVRKNFLQPENPGGLKLEIPRRLLEIADIRDLFLMASLRLPGQSNDSPGRILQAWGCSILKVMHTIAHIDKDLRVPYFGDIQKQIFDRFYKVIHRDADEALYLGDRDDDPQRVNLVAFETKPKKSRESTILKLLHKPENVAEDIFDRVGIRFVTESLLGALRVVKYLRDKMIIMPPNVKPSRSRNTLMDLDPFRAELAASLSSAERGEIGEDQLVERLSHHTRTPSVNPDNPHSSEFYRSLQFTGRQLIKLKVPLFDDLRELKAAAKGKDLPEDLLRIVDRIDASKYLQREIRFFYPYEVQIMDRQSAEENEKGRSAHSEYKKAQLQTALRRVMGSLVDVAR